MSTRL